MERRPDIRALIVFAALAGLLGLVVGIAGSWVLGVSIGLITLALGLAISVWGPGRSVGGDADPGRRNLLVAAGLGGLAWAVAGPSVGWAARKLGRPDPRPVQEAMATGLGSEYMELVRRTFIPRRSGDLQLLLGPYNSSNYPQESLSLVPQDPRTSHASVWMYLERIPLVVHAPGRVSPSDSEQRVTLADLAPTTAQLIGYDGWPGDRDGTPLPLSTASTTPPRVVVTYVIDGGGWNVLRAFPDDWSNLRTLMGESANFRNAIVGSFPAVTACAHATIGTGSFPNVHGITGHNLRDADGVVRKAYREPGAADPSDIYIPTLADLWHEETGAWVGQIGYQVWHLGMLGYGGRDRPSDDLPVGVYWDEDGSQRWEPHNPDLYRLPSLMPDPGNYERYLAEFVDPGWDAEFTPVGRQSPCCRPPIVRYQDDVLATCMVCESVGMHEATDLLYTTYKSPDYTGHVYGMGSRWTGLQLRAVDQQIGRLKERLDNAFPDEYALIVTADHGQCPLPDSVGGVRLDPIQLERFIESRFSGVTGVVESVVPSEVFLNVDRLRDNGGATIEDVAASLADYRYRQNIGAYVPRSAVEQDLLDQKEFAAVFGTTFLESLPGRDLAEYGDTAYADGDPDGMPGPLI